MTMKKMLRYCLFCTKEYINPDQENPSKCDLQSQILECKTKRNKPLYSSKTEELFDHNNIVNFTIHVRKFCELFQLESEDTFTKELTEFMISSTLLSKRPLCQDCQNRMKLIAKVMASIQNLQVQLIRLKIAVEADLKLNNTRLLPIPLITNITKGTSDVEIAIKTSDLRRRLRKKLQLDLNAKVPVGRENVPNIVDNNSDDGKFADLITINILPSVMSVDGSKQTMIQFDGVDEVDLDVNEVSQQFNVVKDKADEIKFDIEIEDTPAELSNDVATCFNDDSNATAPGNLVEETECTAIDNDDDNIYFEETVMTESNISIIELPEEVEVALADHDYLLPLSDIEPHSSNTKQPKKSEPPNVEKASKVFPKKYKSKPSNEPNTTCAKKRGRPRTQNTDKAVKKSKGYNSKVLQGTIANLANGESMGEEEEDQVRLDSYNTKSPEELHLPLSETNANEVEIKVEAQVESLVATNIPRTIRVPKGLLKHRKLLPFKCTFVDPVKGECNKRAVDQDRLDAHVNSIHKKLPRSKAYQCNLCSFTSDAFTRLDSHRKIHAEIKDVTCEICGMSFRSEKYLLKHKRRKHGEPFPFQCDMCEWGFNSRYDLQMHDYKNHGDGRNYTHQCSVCGAGFYAKQYLGVHMLKHAEPTFQCDECHKMFKDRGRLNRHKLKHTGIRPFVCDVCDWKFFTKRHLDLHKTIHTKKRPFLCQECGFSCRLKELLSSHLKVHENNKSLAEKGIKKQPRLAKPRNRRIKTFENNFPPSVSTLLTQEAAPESIEGADTETQQVESGIGID